MSRRGRTRTLVAGLVILAACGEPGLRERTVVSGDGVPIYSAREGNGPPVVLIHGWCCDSTYWRPTAKVLARDHTVVMLDLAGHGRSGLGRQDYTVEAFAEDVVAVLRSLDLHDAVLVGHSLGATVAVAAAVAEPGRVRAVIGVDALQQLDWGLTPAQLQGFTQTMRDDFPGFMQGFVADMFPTGVDTGQVRRVIVDMSQEPVDTAISAFTEMFQYDLGAAARALKVPLRLIVDDARPVDVQAWRAAGVDIDVTTLKASGHFPMLTQPQAFDRLLQATLAQLPGRSSP